MYKKINKYQSDVHVYEFNPLENPSQIVKSSNRRQTLDKFQHKWFLDRGYKQQCVINLGFFHMANPNSLHMGLLARDGGFTEGVPNNGMECWLEKDGTFKIAQLNNDGVKGIGDNWDWGTSLAYSLVMDGKKRIEGTKGFNTTSKVERTAIGQKADKNMVLLVADRLTGNELADVMINLGCITAICGDGGGSSSMLVNGKYVKQTSRAIGSALIVFGKDEVKKPDDTGEVVNNLKISIDAGHGPETQGKRTPDDSMREFHFNAPVADLVKEELEQHENVDVLFTHEPNRDVPLSERTKKANDWGADLFVSVHANAFGNGDWNNVQGIETFVHTSKPQKAYELAAHVQNALIRATSRPNRGVKTANFQVLRETNMTSILAECGFMTNREEAELLKSDSYRQKCAVAIVKAIVDYYKLKRKTKEAPKNGLYRVQVGAFSNEQNAKLLAEELKGKGYSTIIKFE